MLLQLFVPIIAENVVFLPTQKKLSMERTIYQALVGWKDNPHRKPLVLQGVRQCGKTYTLKEFGRKEFEQCAYFNFEKDKNLADVFKYDYDTDRIMKELGYHTADKQPIGEGCLVIFDEVQECPEAITSLKYFLEEKPGLHLVAAGSLLGPAIHHQRLSFPVGKVEFMTMYPMSFTEFYQATEASTELSLINSYALDRPLSETQAARMKRMLKEYYVVGGMPEAVQRWVDTRSVSEVDKVLDDILESYSHDFGKYLSAAEALKVGWIWESVPVQLAKENNKFVFSHVKAGKRSNELEEGLNWLEKAGLVYKLCLVSSPELPLSFNADTTYFKVYLSDVGLLRRRCGMTADTILQETPLYHTFKGAFTENYVLNELVKLNFRPYFWRSANSSEVDFIMEDHERIVPLETKAEGNTKAKSFGVYCSRYNPPLGFKLSMLNVGCNHVGHTFAYSLPLYLLWKLPRYLA